MEKAKFVIKPVKLKAECKDCGKKYRPELPGMPCGKCGSFNTKITAGKELTVKTIEME